MDSAAFQRAGSWFQDAVGFGMLWKCCFHVFRASTSQLLSTGGDEGGRNDVTLLQVKDSSAKKENTTKLNTKTRIT